MRKVLLSHLTGRETEAQRCKVVGGRTSTLGFMSFDFGQG